MTETSDREHFTAWLVNAPSALDQACMDVTVLQDGIISYTDTDGDGEYDPETDEFTIERIVEPVWATDTSKDTAFYAVTTVDAREGDVQDAITEAEQLLSRAGWRTEGAWDAVDNAYIVTVERDV